jgi:hypothetical protein
MFAFLALIAVSAFAEQQRKDVQPMRPMPSAVAAQHDRVQRLLPPATKQKVEGLVPAFREEVKKLPPQADFEQLASSRIRKAFPRLSVQQSNVLVFALLKQTAESMSDTSEMSQLQLQMTMDRRSKLIEALSNMLKTIEDTSDSIVQNLK